MLINSPGSWTSVPMVVTPTAMSGPRKWHFHPSGSQVTHPLSSGHVQVANSYSQMPKRKARKFTTIKFFKQKKKKEAFSQNLPLHVSLPAMQCIRLWPKITSKLGILKSSCIQILPEPFWTLSHATGLWTEPEWKHPPGLAQGCVRFRSKRSGMTLGSTLGIQLYSFL